MRCVALLLPITADALRMTGAPRMMAGGAAGETELMAKFGLPRPENYVTDRRSALGIGAAAAATPLLGFMGPAAAADGMFSVPPLPYDYNALEPHIDAATMKFHRARRSGHPAATGCLCLPSTRASAHLPARARQ